MKIDIERLPNCQVNIHVELDPDTARSQRKRIVGAFAKQVRLPGYRPGKAPAHIIEARYKDDVRAELHDRLLNQALSEAIREKNLRVLNVLEVKDATLAPDDSFACRALLSLEPEFELPDYSEIVVSLPDSEPSSEALDRFIDAFRMRAATFEDITDRGAEYGDFVQVDLEGKQDGAPLADIHPDLPANVAVAKNFWLQLEEDAFLPGFCARLLGARPGESQTFELQLPETPSLGPLSAQTVSYETVLRGLKCRVLPALDDAFAKAMGAPDFAGFREQTAALLRDRRADELARLKRDRILQKLLENADFELPANLVYSETRRIVDDIVKNNSERGVPEDMLKEKEKEIVGGAAQRAQQRVRGTFLLLKIAEKEGIEVSAREFDQRFAALAESAGQPAARLRKELEKRGVLDRIHEEFLQTKVMDWLANRTRVTTEAPTDPPGGADADDPEAP